MRELTDITPPLSITAIDEPGPGGANHVYVVEAGEYPQMLKVCFQKGGVVEHGINGVTNEALLEIVRDRLQCFQAGPFACPENGAALSAVERALMCLHLRTMERKERGVEGREIV